MESIYEYGSRAGFWRLWRMFTELKVQATVYGVTLAMARNPEAVAAMKEAGWEIASHGYRWLEYKDFPEDLERKHILEAVRLHTELTGERPYGMYQGKPSDNTLRLVQEEGGFLYSSDSYADDLPYWVKGVDGKPFLIIPYTLETNDMRFATPQGFNSGDQFFTYLKDAFDTLYEEGKARQPEDDVGRPALPSRRPAGPGRGAEALHRICAEARQGLDSAPHRYRRALAQASQAGSGLMISRDDFVSRFGGVFEHSPFIAERAYDDGFVSDAVDRRPGAYGACRHLPRREP